jgi:plasmid stability protein
MTNASEALLPRPELEPGTAAEMEAPAAPRLNHLQALEAESIYILREAAAEFARPVMLSFAARGHQLQIPRDD